MRIIQSPDESISGFGPSLFLAGGISNCPNWQEELSEKYTRDSQFFPEDLEIYNPRRIGDLAKNGAEASKQIYWERRYLDMSTHLLFWFPEETVCPITLFELGKYLTYRRLGNFEKPWQRIFIGMHPNYSRRFDLELQIPLIMPQCNIYYSLEDLYQSTVIGLGIHNGF